MKVEQLINVGIADIKCSNEANVVLRTILGSCVGICIYDESKKIGGLAHIMLPYPKGSESNFMKYADSAIPYLIRKIEELGSKKNQMIAKITGGASMFKTSITSIMGDIGKNNSYEVTKVLKQIGIPIVAEDSGGKRGRTIDFYINSGILRVKKFGEKEIFI